MIAFINERSLGQYGDWAKALILFVQVAQELSAITPDLFKDSRYFERPEFKQRFNALAFPRDQRALVRQLAFSTQYYKCWTPDRLSLVTENYNCQDPIVNLNDESLSEAAERMLNLAQTISVISAADSPFHLKTPLNIAKVSSGQSVGLRNATSLDGIRQWVISDRGYYNVNSQTPPHDFQTILMKDSARFKNSGKVERRSSRRVFEEVATGRLYYVDAGHVGHSAHLEVFSANRVHLGTADIGTGALNTGTEVNGRTLRL